ncbi:uncharacterized protein FOMMEDRAFT_97946 [Fomitiporia mediterranea MF3/22]|uniref:uncharacterized protein n=1 Tax=Fomitiporia mediterranea (strain MF3/22) TaxID=694068 RepID=UPI0004408838|nr:uncharacterized protein FOMMEDRAFT_97946 [Fomitiporia mediterranea MF3/22]EJC97856.1 hypothetical protein FOMMEDRAFT_97946 [Fomitiporia mediterranea MF3/22]
MTPFTILYLVVASCFVQLAQAVPLVIGLARRDVADPPVLAPNASTVWTVGDTQTVVWCVNTSGLPEQITNRQGTVLLGFLNDTSGDEHLMIDSPLASGFDITSGSVDVVVPDVEPRTDYIIALLGDSGNISPKFTIKSSSGSAPSTVPSTTSSTAASTSESGPTSEPTVSTLSAPNLPTGATPSPAPANLTTASEISTSSLAAQSTQSGSASAPPASSDTSSNTSSSAIQITHSRLLQFIIPLFCMLVLV